MAFYMFDIHIPSEINSLWSTTDKARRFRRVSYLSFVNRFNVLLEIWRTRETIITSFTNVFLVIILMNFFDMRIHVRLCSEYFRARRTWECFIWKVLMTWRDCIMVKGNLFSPVLLCKRRICWDRRKFEWNSEPQISHKNFSLKWPDSCWCL